jgi:hypothetical protein
MDVGLGRRVSTSTRFHESPSVGSGDDLAADAGGNVRERKAGC